MTSLDDYSVIDSKLRRTVRFLREHGYHTFRSGYFVERNNCPFVQMITEPNLFLCETRLLISKLNELNIQVHSFDNEYLKVSVQGIYDPVSRRSIIWLYGLDDKLLPKDAGEEKP